jgi:glycosyltransferase involved in cell wall biosynthesis
VTNHVLRLVIRCSLRNVAYTAIDNIVTCPSKRKDVENLIMVQEMRNRYSAQLIVAALNEAPGIGLTIAEMKDTLGEIPVLVVDGKSSDRTVEIAKNMGAKVVFQDGIGKGDALAKALQHVDPSVNYVILTDADYTYPAEYVPAMIRILEENPLVGMVCGNRLEGIVDRKAIHGVFHIGNRLLALAHNMLNGVPLQDPLTGLRVIRTEVLQGWSVRSKGFDIEVELNHLVERRGFKTKEIPISYRTRLGEKKLKVSHGLTIFMRILLETAFRTNVNPIYFLNR